MIVIQTLYRTSIENIFYISSLTLIRGKIVSVIVRFFSKTFTDFYVSIYPTEFQKCRLHEGKEYKWVADLDSGYLILDA
jgi:hypothetical protein